MRPAVQNDSLQISDDDLTHKLNDVIKANNNINSIIKSDKNDKDKYTRIHYWWQLLQYHIATYVDNKINKIPKAASRSGRAFKTLRQRIMAKEGRIRGNLMGKRVDGSARTVITPEPNISIDELAVPIDILKNLTYPEVVTEYNVKQLTVLVRNGPNYPGAKSIRFKNNNNAIQKLGSQGFRYKNVLKYLTQEQRNGITLKPGDIVYRHIMEGDWVFFNRQPTLHKMSMMGHRVRARTSRSFGLHPNVTTPYGADFDGDKLFSHLVLNSGMPVKLLEHFMGKTL
jgi:DNA-directed RNA polymerase beta' subunit